MIHSRLHHKNIINFYDRSHDHSSYVIGYFHPHSIMYIFDHIRIQLDSKVCETVNAFAVMIFDAILYLLDRDVIHVDLRMESIAVEPKNNSVLLYDFSNSFIDRIPVILYMVLKNHDWINFMLKKGKSLKNHDFNLPPCWTPFEITLKKYVGVCMCKRPIVLFVLGLFSCEFNYMPYMENSNFTLHPDFKFSSFILK